MESRICYVLMFFSSTKFSLSQFEKKITQYSLLRFSQIVSETPFLSGLAVSSEIECAFACTGIGRCCSASFDFVTRECDLFSHCTPVTISNVDNSVLLNHSTGIACESGWKKFNDHCYQFQCQQKHWGKAKADCEELGAHHVAIETIEEMDWIWQEYPCTDDITLWTDLYDQSKRGNWVHSQTGHTASYLPWYPLEPNDIDGVRENCGCLRRKELHDNFCFMYERPSLCEKIKNER